MAGRSTRLVDLSTDAMSRVFDQFGDPSVVCGTDVATIAFTRLLMCGNKRMTEVLKNSFCNWRMVVDSNVEVTVPGERSKKNGVKIYNCGECVNIDPRLDTYPSIRTIKFFLDCKTGPLRARSPKKNLCRLVSKLLFMILKNPPSQLVEFCVIFIPRPSVQMQHTILPSKHDILRFVQQCPMLQKLDVDVRPLCSIGLENVAMSDYVANGKLSFSHVHSVRIRDGEPKPCQNSSFESCLSMESLSTFSTNCSIAPSSYAQCASLSSLHLQTGCVPDALLPFLTNLTSLSVEQISTNGYYNLLPRTLRYLSFTIVRAIKSRSGQILSGLPDEEPDFPPGLAYLYITASFSRLGGVPYLIPHSVTSLDMNCSHAGSVLSGRNVLDQSQLLWQHDVDWFRAPVVYWGLASAWLDLINNPPSDYPNAHFLSLNNLVHLDLNINLDRNPHSLRLGSLSVLKLLRLNVRCWVDWVFKTEQVLPPSLTTLVFISPRWDPIKFVVNLDALPNLVHCILECGAKSKRVQDCHIKIKAPLLVRDLNLEMVALFCRRQVHLHNIQVPYRCNTMLQFLVGGLQDSLDDTPHYTIYKSGSPVACHVSYSGITKKTHNTIVQHYYEQSLVRQALL